jgi:N-acetylneuraminic acid mutarotase
MNRQSQRFTRCVSVLAGAVTLAGMALLSAAPADAAAGQTRPAAAGAAGRAHPTAPAVGHAAPATPHATRSTAHAAQAAAHPARTSSHRTARPHGVAFPPSHPTRHVCGKPAPGHATCLSIVRTDVKPRRGILGPQSAPGGYGPADLQAAYDLPSASAGAGQTVAVVDAFDDPNAEADLAIYRAQYGMPACTTDNGCFRKVAQDGSTNYPQPNSQWAGEISLDLDMVSAICPNCHILLVEANSTSSTDLGTAVDEAVTLGAKFVSNSYGSFGESPSETTLDPYYNHPGVVITASAGDYGYDNSQVGLESPSYPAVSPYVTSVGGTSLVRAAGTARGWAETVWPGSGAGCSAYESKPAWQHDASCPGRTDNDVSAVADPNTGVAVYDTYQVSGGGGWTILGGTSVGSPIIAATYALAGTPAAGSYPASYLYSTPSALNDITSGSDGSCGGSYLCTAGPGYDGPSGLGTPNGVAAFTPPGPRGEVTGTVTSASTGKPVAGAQISGHGASAVSGPDGSFQMSLPAGTYNLRASAFGYHTASTGVRVQAGKTSTASITLVPLRMTTISGTVTDGSGHGWPLYAQIQVPGTPVTTYSSPYTGRYAVKVPAGPSYTLQVSPEYQGYLPTSAQVTAQGRTVTQNITIQADTTACTAPGYGFKVSGFLETFDGQTTPPGWSVINNTSAGGWVFNDPGSRGNQTGGSGGFAIVDDSYLGGAALDTELVSPVTDLSGVSNPSLTFDTEEFYWGSNTGTVDLSLDGGSTWNTVWTNPPGGMQATTVSIPLPQAANQSDVQIRFHFTGQFGWWWEIDNVLLGVQNCDPVPGGLVAGQVTDANTGQPLDGATVTSDSGNSSTSTAPAPGIGDGFYSMFDPAGGQPFTASQPAYTPATRQVTVAPDAVTKAGFKLGAGHLVISPAAVTSTEQMGGQASQPVTFSNNGSAAVHVTLDQQGWNSTVLGRQVIPVRRVKGHYPLSLRPARHTARRQPPSAAAGAGHGAAGTGHGGRAVHGGRQAAPLDSPWAPVASFPNAIEDNAVVTTPDGKVYSIGGDSGSASTNTGQVLDPATQTWSPIANLPQQVQEPAAAYIDGKIYVIGGIAINGVPVSTLEIYDPAANTWSTGPAVPAAYGASAVAVLGGKMYVVGGFGSCDSPTCSSSDVWVYDPGTNTWSQAASYPQPVSWESCGAIDSTLYCAGGAGDTGTTSSAYAYEPAANAWSPIASLPIDLAAAGYTSANGQLLVSGGVTADATVITNQGFAYDPASNTWSSLPNASDVLYRGGSTCGFYRIGGSAGSSASAADEMLPGYAGCGAGDRVPWLSQSPASFTVPPSASVTVNVTLNAGDATVTQPGTYTARIDAANDSPYADALPVTMTVTPPRTWGKITGQVTGRYCDGTTTPLANATVGVTGKNASYTLHTDGTGSYALWLPVADNPLSLIAALDGWQPQGKTVKIRDLQTTTTNFTLNTAASCG